MYSRDYFLKRAQLAKQMSELPENAARRRDYLTVADNWRTMAGFMAAEPAKPAAPGKTQISLKAWETTLDRAMRDAGLT
jgi:hypothetical protein